MFEKFTELARQTMAFANQEAQRLNHEYVGTEHILLALAKQEEGCVPEIFKQVSISYKIIDEEIAKLVKAGQPMVVMGKLPLTPRGKLVIENAIKEAEDLKDNFVGTEHLLLGLLRDRDSVATQIFYNQGITPEGLGDIIKVALGKPLLRSLKKGKNSDAIAAIRTAIIHLRTAMLMLERDN